MDDDTPITITSIDTHGVSGPPAEDGILQPGTQFGRYVIKKVLGEGGMGVVYAAYDPTLNRKIAIKVLRVSSHVSDIDTHSARARMLREAQAMAMVGHPNLVQVFDVGTYQNDVYIAMEFVEGITLREWQKTNPKAPWREVLQKYLDAAKGLSAAHKRHLIHRDFKPDNVMVSSDGHVRVMDFGLARHTGQEDTNTTTETPNVLAHPLTQTGMIMGTPAYMAPEQFLADDTDHRTDQFCFCIALFEALYGYRPFQGETMKGLARSVMRGEITLPGKSPVDDHILGALLKGLQTELDDRHDNMDMLLDALITEPDTTTQGKPWIMYITSFAVLISGILLYWFSAQLLNDRPPPPPPPGPPPMKGPPPPPLFDGVITHGQMVAILKKYEGEVQECADRAHERDPKISGTIRIDFEIGVDPENPARGKVVRAILDHHAMFDKPAARCVLGMAMNWDFPAPACPGAGAFCKAKVHSEIQMKAADELPSGPRKKAAPSK